MNLKRILFLFLFTIGFSHLFLSSFSQSSSSNTERRIDSLLKQMTLAEKLDYIGGSSYRYIRSISRLKIPAISMSDGPLGVGAFGKSTAYPAGIMLAATWDTALTNQLGHSLGRDSKARGVHILLAPGVNIYRAPMCGRNFEYFGEDPFLASRIAVNYIEGLQNEKVVATIKHFVANNQEWDRHKISSDVDERTLQEIYLPAFKAAVIEANAGCVMNSYNLLNGTHTTELKSLNLDLLKKEWKFNGILMSDWHATYDGLAAATNGLDIEMPSGHFMNKANLMPAIQNGQLPEELINDKVRRILRIMISYGFYDHPQMDNSIPKDDPQSAEVALNIAREGAVLLKNEAHCLPLKNIRTLAVVGPNADAYIAGGGSSAVQPYHYKSILQGLKAIAGDSVQIIYAADNTSAMAAAEKADAVIVCIGFNSELEQENFDRTFELPGAQDSLIRSIAKLNSRTIVVLNAGGNVDMQNWLSDIKGLLHVWYAGQEGGQAIAEILFGKINPSGKIPASFEKKWKDNPTYHNYYDEDQDGHVSYKEGLFVGYRYWDTTNIQPQFHFGFGLSYTKFSYYYLKVTQTKGKSPELTISFEIKNTGDFDGAEIPQVYVHQLKCPVIRPYKELKGFARVTLKKGESKTVTISLDKNAFSYYKETQRSFGYDPGRFDILIGASSKDIRLKGSININ